MKNDKAIPTGYLRSQQERQTLEAVAGGGEDGEGAGEGKIIIFLFNIFE